MVSVAAAAVRAGFDPATITSLQTTTPNLITSHYSTSSSDPDRSSSLSDRILRMQTRWQGAEDIGVMQGAHVQNNVRYSDSDNTISLDIYDPKTMKDFDDNVGSTGKGILIGMLSAFGSAAFVALLFMIIYFFRYTSRGRIFLDRLGRPGEYDDEQAFLREETEALEQMDEMQKAEYLRAKAFIQGNPPETMQTDISLSQFLAIQEKGVAAWEFEPELEIANCFVEGRTEIEFFDSECSVQSNLPIPKQNEVYYFEAKIYDKPESTLLSIGLTTKPYPLFRMPGWHKTSVAYTSSGQRRYNQPFTPTIYGPEIVQGDVIGVGYRPRTGTVFFSRNGKKLEDVAHGLKTQNFFPTVGANGPCTVHVNFGQSGFVFIEANVKKWGLAPMTGSLAPPPPYGSEQGSILLEAGRESVAGQRNPPGGYQTGHNRTRSRFGVVGGPTSPGPVRSPTDISLSHLAHIPSHEDIGEGSSRIAGSSNTVGLGLSDDIHQRQIQQRHYQQYQQQRRQQQEQQQQRQQQPQSEDNVQTLDPQDFAAPPPDYTSPEGSMASRSSVESADTERAALLKRRARAPIPSYEAATGSYRADDRRDVDGSEEEEDEENDSRNEEGQVHHEDGAGLEGRPENDEGYGEFHEDYSDSEVGEEVEGYERGSRRS
ncbi:Rsp5p-dependent ubiquitination, sorting of cargo proteins at the multivesicular body [Agyrium rufum]|nr:Rsp5p-dependent ubiquitination, sorting of cargo proteins at the multivesicular body [Agyrium rufum]